MIKSLQYVSLFAICFFTNPLFSQTGPGGVGKTDGTSNLVLWLNPDKGINSSRVWKDQSGKGYDFTAGVGAALNSNAVNGYNAYTFNGSSDYFQKSAEDDFNVDEFSIFSASKVLSSNKHKAILSYRDEYNTYIAFYGWKREKYGFMLYSLPNSNNWSFWTGKGVSDAWSELEHSTQSTVANWSIQNINYKNGTGGKRLSINSTVLSSDQKMSENTVRPFRVGAGRNESTPDFFFKGDIGEVIMYKSVINEAQRIIVNNYLAAKYNSSLIATEDFYIQDNLLNGNFDHHVAGIGQASNGSRHTNSQGTGIVRIDNSVNLSNNSFLFWGEETKNATYNFSTNNSNYSEQLNSKWRVNNHRNVGEVDVSFDATKMTLPVLNGCKDLQLVVDNNANFSSPRVYALTLSNAVAKATGVTFNDSDYFTIRYVDQIVWNGAQYFNGARPNQAPNNDSDKCLKLLIKSGATAVLTENAHVREIEVEAGATLEVADGVELSVEKMIINNGTIDLLGEAQLIQKHIGSNANSGTGKLKVRQQGTTNLHNYNYWSSPVNRNGSWQIGFLEQINGQVNFSAAHNANPNTNPITLSSRWLYSYNASIEIGYFGWLSLSKTSTILPGIGYTMKGSGSTNSEEEYVFSGVANSGDYVYGVTKGNDFLIGNPYPSTLNANQFILDNLDVTTGTLYFYEQFESNNTHVLRDYQGGYATLNLLTGVAAAADSQLNNGGSSTKGKPTNNIAVGQGFFVTIDQSTSLKFNNSQRVFAKESNGGSIFYREETTNIDSRTKFWLSFTDPSGRSREIALGYDENATTDIDKGYDAIDYSDYPDNMLWDVADNLLVIQGLNQFNVEDEMLLSIKITTPGTYMIGLTETMNFPENTAIYLKDNLENSFYNLRTEDVAIAFQTGTFNNRYSIVYQRETLGMPTLEENQSVYVKFDKNANTAQLLGIDNLNSIKAVYMYSVDGKQVKYFKGLDSKIFNVSYLNDGVYILKLEMTSGASKNIRFVKY